MKLKHLQEIILASASPRRSHILESLGIIFSTFPVDIDESQLKGEEPVPMVLRLSAEKAGTAGKRFPESLIIAADTIVVKDGQILGKPKSNEDASRMLSLLAGSDHSVITGIAVYFGQMVSKHCETIVSFKSLIPDEISW